MASIFKSKYYEYKEYHNSLDNLNFVKAINIKKSLEIYKKIINEVEKVNLYESNIKFGEPMLSKRNLYKKTGGSFIPKKKFADSEIILWVLFLLDGQTTIEQISEKLKIRRNFLIKLIKKLVKKKLIKEI